MANLTALANMVGEYKVTWQKNLRAVAERGEEPSNDPSVKESFAHYSAAERMFIAVLAGDDAGGSDIPQIVIDRAKRMVRKSFAWQNYAGS